MVTRDIFEALWGLKELLLSNEEWKTEKVIVSFTGTFLLVLSKIFVLARNLFTFLYMFNTPSSAVNTEQSRYG